MQVFISNMANFCPETDISLKTFSFFPEMGVLFIYNFYDTNAISKSSAKGYVSVRISIGGHFRQKIVWVKFVWVGPQSRISVQFGNIYRNPTSFR